MAGKPGRNEDFLFIFLPSMFLPSSFFDSRRPALDQDGAWRGIQTGFCKMRKGRKIDGRKIGEKPGFPFHFLAINVPAFLVPRFPTPRAGSRRCMAWDTNRILQDEKRQEN